MPIFFRIRAISPLFAFLAILCGEQVVHAQKRASVIQAACGPSKVKYDTQKTEQQPISEPKADSALIYVFSQLDYGGLPVGCQVVTRIGVDGRWVGANCGSSYVTAVIPAGEHHLCADWQSAVFLSSRPYPALDSFTAEPGKIYYFRAKVVYIKGVTTIDLGPLNADEGRLLIASSAASISKPKN
jgi:hypothetical protein